MLNIFFSVTKNGKKKSQVFLFYFLFLLYLLSFALLFALLFSFFSLYFFLFLQSTIIPCFITQSLFFSSFFLGEDLEDLDDSDDEDMDEDEEGISPFPSLSLPPSFSPLSFLPFPLFFPSFSLLSLFSFFISSSAFLISLPRRWF